MEKVIKCAIEGGYKYRHWTSKIMREAWIENSGEVVVYENGADVKVSALPQEIVCDSAFWQALGKACGWSDSYLRTYAFEDSERSSVATSGYLPAWQYYAMHFHEINLTESWSSAISYLVNLVEQGKK